MIHNNKYNNHACHLDEKMQIFKDLIWLYLHKFHYNSLYYIGIKYYNRP